LDDPEAAASFVGARELPRGHTEAVLWHAVVAFMLERRQYALAQHYPATGVVRAFQAPVLDSVQMVTVAAVSKAVVVEHARPSSGSL
jgi:hypothetical protein